MRATRFVSNDDSIEIDKRARTFIARDLLRSIAAYLFLLKTSPQCAVQGWANACSRAVLRVLWQFFAGCRRGGVVVS